MRNEWLENLIQDCRQYCPWIIGRVVDYRSGRDNHEVIAELDDGSRVIFDTTIRGFQYLSPEMNGETMTDLEEDLWRKEFSEMFRRKLRQSGIPLWKLSKITGISEQALSGYLHRRGTPSLYRAYRIANALDCSIDDLADAERKFRL